MTGSGSTGSGVSGHDSPLPSPVSEAYLQAHFLPPQGEVAEHASPAPCGVAVGPVPPQGALPLASPLRNSTKGADRLICPTPVHYKGVCNHGNVHWQIAPCKRRTCPVCGPERLRRAANDLRYGVAHLGGLGAAGFFVGTFTRRPSKALANRTLQKWIRWIRRDLQQPVQYAVVWELQKRGSLHCNVILAPWQYVPWETLFAAWRRFGGGRDAYISRPQQNIFGEVVKSNDDLNIYLHKMEQMVLTGRAINYSRAWPRPPKQLPLKRLGYIKWISYDYYHEEVRLFRGEQIIGIWRRIDEHEWESADNTPCECFERPP